MKFLLLVLLTNIVNAESIEKYSFKSPELQIRYQNLIAEIRCPVCQGQSIGGSNAPLAQDLRKVVRSMLNTQKNDDDIFAFMRERYGDFVVFKPPVNNQTYLLWFAPPFFVLLAIFTLMRRKKPKEKIINNTSLDKAKNLLDS